MQLQRSAATRRDPDASAAPRVPQPRRGAGTQAAPAAQTAQTAESARDLGRARLLTHYERRTEVPLAIGAIAFLLVYALPVAWPALPPLGRAACASADRTLWVVFAVDLAVRTWLHEHRWQFLRRHPIDVLVVVVPVLRPLRVLRVITAAQALSRRGGLLRSVEALTSAAALLVVIGAVAELDAERSAPGASITTIGDALWWAVTTVTTVGYGDLTPVTVEGRVVGAVLMLTGVSFVGTITAMVGAWFVARHHEDTVRETGEIHELARQVRELRDEIVRDRAARPTAGEPPPG